MFSVDSIWYLILKSTIVLSWFFFISSGKRYLTDKIKLGIIGTPVKWNTILLKSLLIGLSKDKITSRKKINYYIINNVTFIDVQISVFVFFCCSSLLKCYKWCTSVDNKLSISKLWTALLSTFIKTIYKL